MANKLKLLASAYRVGGLPLLFLVLKVSSAIRRGGQLNINKKLKIKKFGQPAELLLTSKSDYETFKEIFLFDIYHLDDIRPSVIVDLGSNAGFSIAYFKMKYPQAKIYGAEPNPNLWSTLKQNVSQFQDVSIFPYALAGQSGQQEFYLSTSSKSSSAIPRPEAREKIKTTAVSLDDFVDKSQIDQIDILKFDIEGSEFDVFRNFKKIEAVHHYYGEVHLDLMGANLDEFKSLFDNYQISIQGTGNRVYFNAVKK